MKKPPSSAGPVAIASLYAPASKASTCDQSREAALLAADPGRAAAFARVLRITPAEIPAFLEVLSPRVLTADVEVTDHGYTNLRAVERQAVLQAGTDVFIDTRRMPVVRCLSGSPLLPPEAVSGTPRYIGRPWAGFSPNRVVRIVPPATALSPGVSPAVSATVSPAVSPAANLIADGDFENGLAAPWGTGIYEPRAEIFWGSADASAAAVQDVTHSGRSALRIVNRSSLSPNVYRTMAQQVAVTAGVSYCLTFWTRAQDATPGILSLTLDRAWAHRVGLRPGTFDWTQYAGTFVAESSTIDVRLISENSGTVWIDDIALTAGGCAVPSGPVPAGAEPRGVRAG